MVAAATENRRQLEYKLLNGRLGPMKPVTQSYSAGCAIACVASRLGFTYLEARRLFDKPDRDKKIGFYCRDLILALARSRKTYRHFHFRDRHRRTLRIPGTIVFIARSKKYPLGHYLLRTQRGWMNPWINFPVISPARSGFEARLPGRPLYVITPEAAAGRRGDRNKVTKFLRRLQQPS
jgi:hypothetical protein